MREKKKVAIIGSVGIPAKYGGFETLAEHLVTNLSEDYDMTVYCSGKRYPKAERISTYKGAELKYIPFEANGIQSIIYDIFSILHAVFKVDILLILGVPGAIVLPFVKWFTNKKVIISIDGIEWKREKWNLLAKWYLFWAERLAVKYSHIDISDNESIQDYTALRYKSLSRVVEYGGDHTREERPCREDLESFPFLKGKYAFKVCRIEPENNIHIILSAFTKMPEETLAVVGNWENSAYGISLKEKFRSVKNIVLLDPIYDQRKLDVLRSNAWIYIHGHSAGGTNPSLVEAMYLGLPIIAFDVSYNRVTTEQDAVYFKNENDLLDKISSLHPSRIQAYGQKMKSIAERRYKWSVIAEKYKLMFEEVNRVNEKKRIDSKLNKLNNGQLLELQLNHITYQENFSANR